MANICTLILNELLAFRFTTTTVNSLADDASWHMMAEIISLEFLHIVKDIPGAEGPVFTKDGRFFMVAPERMKNDQFAGEIYEIDITTKDQVCTVHFDSSFNAHDSSLPAIRPPP